MPTMETILRAIEELSERIQVLEDGPYVHGKNRDAANVAHRLARVEAQQGRESRRLDEAFRRQTERYCETKT